MPLFLAIYELRKGREGQTPHVEKPHFGLFPSRACVICITIRRDYLSGNTPVLIW